MKKNLFMNVFFVILIFGMLFNTFFIQNEKHVNIKLEKQNFQLNFQIPKKSDSSIIADHSILNLIRNDQIPESVINSSKENLHIAYGHTSHGSQIIYGMSSLIPFKENLGGTPDLYEWNDGPMEGELDIDDRFVSGDLGHNGDLTWEASTRTYLDDGNHDDVNVVMWSWCGGVSDNTEEGINTYLNAMNQLELDYPTIQFVYMTGHADGSGDMGNCHIRNQQIRDYCLENNKILFDFYDIECYDLDGNYFGDKNVTDECNYDSDGNGSLDSNWALEWQGTHTEDVDWYDCSCPHSQALNGNQKAYAIWWLWARLAGWSEIEVPILSEIVPNPSYTGEITLNWAESQDADNYTIYRDYSYIDGYKESLIEIGNTENTYFYDSVSVDAVYFYAVCSTNETGTSDFSNCVNVSVEFLNLIPPTLELLSPNPSNTGEISLNWTESLDADNYTIYRDLSYINDYKDSLIEIGNTEETHFNDLVSVAAVYYYAICFSNETGTSALSNCVNVSVIFPNPTPPILELISSNPSNTGDVSLNWTENPNGLQYTIYRYSSLITELNSSLTNLYQTSTPGYSEKILSQGKYYYVVTTTTVNGTSDISNCVSVLIDFSYKDLLSNMYLIGGAAIGFLALLSIGIVIIRKKKKR